MPMVVVGAGLAGMAAAQRLYKLGLLIGAGVYTINHSNYRIELGAQWLRWHVDKNLLDDVEKVNLLAYSAPKAPTG